MTNIRAMFDERMSSGQLLAEYYADLSEIQKQTMIFDQSDCVSKYLKKHKKQKQILLTGYFTSLRGNGYLGVLIYTQNKKATGKKWCFTSFHIGLMNTSKGMCAIAFYAQCRQAIKFSPHFFRRYKERFGRRCDVKTQSQLVNCSSIIDIMSVYMQRNLSMTWIETRSVFSNNTHIFAPVNDGVALLQWDKRKKLLQANTFVTSDMLNEKQMEMVKYAKVYLSLSDEQKNKFQYPDFISND